MTVVTRHSCNQDRRIYYFNTNILSSFVFELISDTRINDDRSDHLDKFKVETIEVSRTRNNHSKHFFRVITTRL